MTGSRLAAFILALLLPLTVAGASSNWTATVTATPEGGFTMGSPKAQVKLVEYGSLTCPHCAQFDRTAMAGISAYVRKGTVSYEYRNFVLNVIDVAAALAARCGGTAKFFPMAHALYATQPQWVGKITSLANDEKGRLQAMSPADQFVRIAQLSGIATIAQRRGIPAVQLRKCLINTAALDRLVKMREAGAGLGVQGTPTFFLNGKMLDVNDWPGVEAEIRRAGG